MANNLDDCNVHFGISQSGGIMKCPKCNAHSIVLDTRFRKTTKVYYRRRKCPSCGFKFSTREIYAKDYTRPVAFIK